MAKRNPKKLVLKGVIGEKGVLKTSRIPSTFYDHNLEWDFGGLPRELLEQVMQSWIEYLNFKKTDLFKIELYIEKFKNLLSLVKRTKPKLTKSQDAIFNGSEPKISFEIEDDAVMKVRIKTGAYHKIFKTRFYDIFSFYEQCALIDYYQQILIKIRDEGPLDEYKDRVIQYFIRKTKKDYSEDRVFVTIINRLLNFRSVFGPHDWCESKLANGELSFIGVPQDIKHFEEYYASQHATCDFELNFSKQDKMTGNCKRCLVWQYIDHPSRKVLWSSVNERDKVVFGRVKEDDDGMLQPPESEIVDLLFSTQHLFGFLEEIFSVQAQVLYVKDDNNDKRFNNFLPVISKKKTKLDAERLLSRPNFADNLSGMTSSHPGL